MDTFDFFVLHNPKVFDIQDTSVPPVFLLSNVFSGSTAGSSLPRHAVPSAASFRLNPFIPQPPDPVPQALSFELSGRNITN